MQFSIMSHQMRLTKLPIEQTRPTSPLTLGIAARSGALSRQLSLTVRASKGFGKAKNPTRKGTSPSSDDDDSGSNSGKASRRQKGGKRVQLQANQIGPIPGQQQVQPLAQASQFQVLEAAAPAPPSEEDLAFMARLSALKEQTKQKEAEAAAAAAAGGDVLAAAPAIFDAPGTAAGGTAAGGDGSKSIYDNPPPLLQTLQSSMAANANQDAGEYTGISDPKLRNADIGPSQLGLGAGALVFIAIFLIVAAGDYAPSSKRYSGVTPALSQPDPIEEKILKGKVARYEDQLKANPTDDSAMDALATSYVRLLQYDKAAAMYEKLANRNPENADIWRLAGESAILSQQPRKAVPAFERALRLRPQPDIQLLTGAVDAYVANGDYGKAVDALRGVREKLRTYQREQQELRQRQAAATTAVAVPAASAVTVVDLAAAVSMEEAPPLTGDAAPFSAEVASASESPAAAEPAPAAPAVEPAIWRLDPVAVELLTGKVYSAWRGHDQDALATYDALIKEFPEDYRGFLAKGLVLKEQGRKADAERMFLQARFFAPSSMQQVVRSIADSGPVLDLPSNN